jgi:hypothetical protein
MLMVYMIRQFSFDLIEHIARSAIPPVPCRCP